ncbi:MAG: hypothetical protein Kow002_06390 [Anaerolineales bacterium]
MNIKQLFQRIKRRLFGPDEIPEELVYRLISRLENTHEDELSCDEVFELVDQYAEANLPEEDSERLKPLIRHHLDLCRECDEEYEALLKVLEGTQPK